MLQERGIEQTALHNHLLDESPRIIYMHSFGEGDPITMASTIHDALALAKTPVNALISAQPTNNSLDTAMFNATIGAKGKYNVGVYQFEIQRNETIMDDDMEVPSSMGLATGINSQLLDNGDVAITGDFVLIDEEINPVIKALRDDINVTVIHNHMIYEEPRLFLLHFWSTVRNQNKLASGLKEALNETNSSLPR